MDFSQCGLEQALIELKFKMGAEYILHVGRDLLRDIINLTGGLQVFNIRLEIQDDLRDGWYVVDEENKSIVYSPGAR
jgi:hypothetical protein